MKNKEPSLGALVDSGQSKEEICKLKNVSPEAYDKAYESLMKIREAKRRAIESQTAKVTIEGRKGLYRIDNERREFQSTENPEDKIPFDTDEEILVTALTCPTCNTLIERLEYKESGMYNLRITSENAGTFAPDKLELLCPVCHIAIDKSILKPIGVDLE